MSQEAKVTYVSIGSDPELDRDFDAALAAAQSKLGLTVPCSIGGRPAAGGALREVRSPGDRRRVVCRAEQASAEEAGRAIELAHAAFPVWRRLGWERRVAMLRAAAAELATVKLQLAARMVFEVGKNRLEAMAEVEEAADLLRYYAATMEAERGFERPLARVTASEATASVLVPYGAWAVVSPFNFPMALAAGMIGAALVAGNTVVFKPSQEAPLSGAGLAAALWRAGVPREVLHLVIGPGSTVGEAMLAHPRTAGVAFTGSYEVGMGIVRQAAREWPRPVVVEMGGKNPAIVGASADVDAAAVAVARSAFGYGGQKCSACSRAYVVRSVAERFSARLVEATRALAIGDPARRETYLGPLISESAVARFVATVAEVRAAGGEILTGGAILSEGELEHGYYVQPTVARLPDPHHRLFGEELFVPLLLVHVVANFDQALAEANRSRFGLTAGLFSRDRAEVDRFLDEIEAGVLYVNRKSGATTGAWPGVNSFGGWKGSGACGVAALGPHYLLKFLREQSRALNDVELA